MVCKFCDIRTDLCKAHIIPKKLYEPAKNGNKSPYIFPTSLTEKPILSQSGIHDSTILCSKCDNAVFGVWDEYGQKLLLEPFNSNNYLSNNNGKNIFYKLENFCYTKFKLFFMSVLWRASITKDKFFNKIDLGVWEPKLKDMLLKNDPGSADDFSVILFKYEGVLGNIMPKPYTERGDINRCIFRAAGYKIIIKVDQRAFSKDIKNIENVILSPSQPLFIPVLKYEDTSEYQSILDIADQIPEIKSRKKRNSPV